MAKLNKEINKFQHGIISTPSSSDTVTESASYSRNIESQASSGRLQGIEKDSILTSDGFQVNVSSIQGDNTAWIDTITFNFVGDASSPAHSEWFKTFGTDVSTTDTIMQANTTTSLTATGWEGHYATIAGLFDVEESAVTSLSAAKYLTISSGSTYWPTDVLALPIGSQIGNNSSDGKHHYAFYFHNDDGEQCYLPGLEWDAAKSKYRVLDGGFTSGNNPPTNLSSRLLGTVIGKKLYSAYMMQGIATKHILELNGNVDWIGYNDTSTSHNYSDMDVGLEYILYKHDAAGNVLSNSDWISGRIGNGWSIDTDLSIDRSQDSTDDLRYLLIEKIKEVIQSSTFYTSSDSSVISSVSSPTAYKLVVTFHPGAVSSVGYATHLFNIMDPQVTNNTQNIITTYPFVHNEFDNKMSLWENVSGGIGNIGGNHTNTLLIETTGDSDSDESFNLIKNANMEDFIIRTQKDDNTKVDIIGIEDLEGNTKSIVSYKNIHGNTPGEKLILGEFNASDTKVSVLQKDDDKVHIGLGPIGGNTKVVSMTKDNPLRSIDSTGGMGLNNSALSNDISSYLDALHTHYVTHEIHGKNPASETISGDQHFISKNDSDAIVIQLDYDVELTTGIAAQSLAWHLSNASGELKDLTVGQVFKTNSSGTADFDDGAMLAWKRYNYNLIESSIVANELYMFCGYIKDSTVPILKFIGTWSANNFGGTSAFAYALKEGSSELTQISLTTTGNYADDTAFAGTSAGNVEDESGAAYALNNTGSRFTIIDLKEFSAFTSSSIATICKCSSPLLFNEIGLLGSGIVYGSSSELFYQRGDLKVYYRHGVFWVSGDKNASNVFRLNVIDFHRLSSEGIKLESLTLDYTKIPSQLHAENGDGIIRRTMQDKLHEDEYDPKNHSWSRAPLDSSTEIIGMCETFESDIRAKNEAGDVYRWRGGDKSSAVTRAICQGEPRINQAGTRAQMYDEFNDPSGVLQKSGMGWNGLGGEDYISQDTTSWNSRLWILFGKRNDDSFDRWDLFLYNVNTINVDGTKHLYMADRTPPYQEAKFVRCFETTGMQTSTAKFYYPGDCAFPMRIATHTYPGEPETNWRIDCHPINNVPGGPLREEMVPAAGDDWADYEIGNDFYHQNVWAFGVYRDIGRWNPIYGIKHWGYNIGWDMEHPRQSKPVKHSLNPLVPFSTAAFADKNIFYSPRIGPNSDGTDSYDAYHTPRHAVTFINNMNGHFIAQDHFKHASMEDYNGWWDDNFEEMGRLYQHPHWTDTNEVGFLYSGKDVRDYHWDLALMTIDEKSGQGTPNFSYYGNNDCAGGARPGFADDDIASVTSFTEANLGFANASTILTTPAGTGYNMGWEGYTDFNTGHYVYINRKWRNPLDDSWLTHETLNPDYPWDTYNNFEDFTTTPSANGAFNVTSCLSIFDNFNRIDGNNTNINTSDGVASWDSGNHGKWRKGKHYYSSDDYTTAAANVYDGVLRNPYYLNTDDEGQRGSYRKLAGMPLCTMHKLKLPIAKVNSVTPIILAADYSYETGNFDRRFISGYLCGVNNSGTGIGSGVAWIRTNFDSLWAKSIRSDGLPMVSPDDNQEFPNGSRDQIALHIPVSTFYDEGLDTTVAMHPLSFARIDKMENAGIGSSQTTMVFNSNLTEDEGPDFQIRASEVSGFNTTTISNNITVFHKLGLEPEFQINDTATHALTLDILVSVTSATNDFIFYGLEENCFALDEYDDAGLLNESKETTGGTFNSSQIFTSATDATIISRETGSLVFSESTENSDGPISAGDHYYKFSMQYDDEYESPLNLGEPFKKTLTAGNGGQWDFIDLQINLTKGFVNSLNRRVTSLVIYKSSVNEDGPYHLLNANAEVKLDDSRWELTADNRYQFTIRDTGATDSSASYETMTGVPEHITDTSLKYGLSAVHHGFMFISQASHAELDDVKRYIFRSQPFNFFAFNYSLDYVILPEIPIAMTSFNSRLFVWGSNHLYKINPITMVIEDTFEGVTIANKYAYVKTEWGLFFFDKNNIYVHNGNTPSSIGDSILYASDTKLKYLSSAYATQGYVKIEQGFRELLEETIKHDIVARIKYLGTKNSVIIFLVNSDKHGVALVYNLISKRWDLWDSPIPKSISGSKDTSIIVNDGHYLYNYSSAISSEYNRYYRQPFDWSSNNINFGTSVGTKIFKTLSFAGIPNIYNTESISTLGVYTGTENILPFDSSNSQSNTIQAYVDNSIVDLTLLNRNYSEIDLGRTQIKTTLTDADFEEIDIISGFRKADTTTDGVSSTITYTNEILQSFINRGHYIKIRDEIMLVIKTKLFTDIPDGENTENNYTTLTVLRAQMGTSKPTVGGTYLAGDIIKVISPMFKFPSSAKGKHMNIRVSEQTGYLDAINIKYRVKPTK